MPEPLNPGGDEDRWLQDAELLMEASLDLQDIERIEEQGIADEDSNYIEDEDNI